MTFLLTIVIGILILGIMVFIHEFGHFFAAKSLGFRVLTFSLGFGTPIVKKRIGETDYQISAIPFGGYVKMAGENPAEERSESPDEFQKRPIWQRAVVATAGPLANFISAMAMLWFVFVWGVERPAYLDRPVIGGVADSSAAKQAGLAPGDSIVSMNGKPVLSWESMENIFLTPEKKFDIAFIRAGAARQTTIVTDRQKSAGYKEPPYGMLPPLPAVIGKVMAGKPAASAGLQPGDTVLAIDSQSVNFWPQLTELIQHGKDGTPLQFTIGRRQARTILQVSPEHDQKENRWIVGINPAAGTTRIVRYAVAPAFHRCLERTRDYTTMIFNVLAKLASREVSARELSGPVGIIPASGYIALQGLTQILNFMALISINLAVLNLFPLIITDGGVLLFLALEAIRREPLSLKTQMAINRFGIAFFLLFFVYVTFNDIGRLPEMFRVFGK